MCVILCTSFAFGYWFVRTIIVRKMDNISKIVLIVIIKAVHKGRVTMSGLLNNYHANKLC